MENFESRLTGDNMDETFFTQIKRHKNDSFSNASKVYFVCDTYEQNSIKGGERKNREESERYMINSPDMKIPSDFGAFLHNGENKEPLFNLIERAIVEGKEDLRDRVVFFSNKAHCSKIRCNAVTILPDLKSDHEEADTKLVALAKAASVPQDKAMLIRSPSGHIDILALFVAHQFENVKQEKSLIYHPVILPSNIV